MKVVKLSTLKKCCFKENKINNANQTTVCQFYVEFKYLELKETVE